MSFPLFFPLMRYKEYQLQDYSTWFLKQVSAILVFVERLRSFISANLGAPLQLNDTDNWMRLKSCLVKSEDCNILSKKYKVLVSSLDDLNKRLFELFHEVILFDNFSLSSSISWQSWRQLKQVVAGPHPSRCNFQIPCSFSYVNISNKQKKKLNSCAFRKAVSYAFEFLWLMLSFGHPDMNDRCGYPAVNASFYDLSFHPVNSNHDCKLYKNSKAVKCYDCDSCK